MQRAASAERVDVAVIGGGQAGLATSRELTRAGVEHLVLERARIGQSWRARWESFCLVTPNWSVALPGHGYDGDDPDGYMPRDDVVAHLERYAAAVEAPVREGVRVTGLQLRPGGGFAMQTSAGPIEARDVVISTGAYQRPHRPAAVATLPADLLQIDAAGYRSPADLPPGPVLVLGSGQTGCQIAEELHEAGRAVFLSCGRAVWLPRRFGGRDLFWWLRETGELEASVSSLPDGGRLLANVLATGRDGGHDLHLRTLRAMGVTLLGHLAGSSAHEARFAHDLADSVAWGDERHRRFMTRVHAVVAERGLPQPEIGEPEPFDGAAPERLDLRGFGAVVCATGYRPDYTSWVRCPEAFDTWGFPLHADGASTIVPGLHFVGVHYLRKRKSALLVGVGEDAAIVAAGVAARRAVAGRPFAGAGR